MLESAEVIKQDLLAMSVIGSVYILNGGVYRVCAGSSAAVRVATVKALNRMRIKVASIGRDSDQDVIFAMSGERKVEVRVESLNAKSARMKISAHQGEDTDVRTAAEVIAQTERLLANPM
jgi:hypothetical protein